MYHGGLYPVDLIQFVSAKVSRISHLDFVTVSDLMSIGMGKPAARRLLDAVKKRKGTLKKKILQTFTNNGVKEKLHDKTKEHSSASAAGSLTCLIKETVSYYRKCIFSSSCTFLKTNIVCFIFRT